MGSVCNTGYIFPLQKDVKELFLNVHPFYVAKPTLCIFIQSSALKLKQCCDHLLFHLAEGQLI
jgi:hypothetical protein